jgi:hypothetical protein
MKKTIITSLMLVIFCSVAWADLGDELLQAAEDGDLSEVERLLEEGADVTITGDYYGNFNFHFYLPSIKSNNIIKQSKK